MISFEQSEAESKTRLKEATGKVSVLETKLEQSLNRESELSANLRQQREAHNVKFVSVEEQLTELKKENCNLKQKLGEEAIERERAVQKLQAEYNETERGAEKWIVDSQIYQDQLKLTQAQLERCQAELKKAQLDAIKFQETAIRSQTANVYSSSEIEALDERVKKFENLFVKEQASSYSLKKQLEKTNAENEMLRSTMQSEMMLHEQLTSLENQITFLRQEVAEKGKAEAERDAVKKELLA
jgi:chromosome segregation ATPase